MVVLPFTNATGNPELDHLSDAMPKELLTAAHGTNFELWRSKALRYSGSR